MRGKRLDIQGLRALAVGIVVLFHLWPEHLPGGYVGVDAFFVISGFLITAHLLSEVERTGTVSLTKFWARRVRRLLPAAFTVLGASLIAAFVILPKALLQQTLYEIGAAAIYVQNWVLAGNSVDYLAADNEPTLAQHFWSLSVEEQFYIAWPVLILIAIWIAGKQGRGNRRAIASALAVVFVASLAFSIFETARSQPSAYFITPTRAWEFAAGGLLVFIPAVASGPISRVVASWGGIALIIFSAVQFGGATPFPGAIALLPVVGTMLLIYAGDSDSAWSPAHVFRFGPIQLLGDVSYAVYLWHWPLIILAPFVLGHELTFRTKVVLLVLTLALATATKFLVEDPVRNAKGRARGRIPTFGFMAAGMAAILVVSSVGTWSIERARTDLAASMASAIEGGCFGAAAMPGSCVSPFAVTGTVDAAFSAADSYVALGLIGRSDCERAPLEPGSLVRDCEFGDTKTPNRTIALVGDSHAEHLFDPLVAYAKTVGWRIIPFMHSGCTAMETPHPNTTPAAAICADWSAQVQAEIAARDDIDVVLFSNRSKTKQIQPTHAADVLTKIRQAGKTVVAIRDVPGMPIGSSAPECVELSKRMYDPCGSPLDDGGDFMMQAAAMAAIPIVNLRPYFCDTAACHAVIGGTIAYFDDNHLTYSFALSLTPYLGASLESILAPKPA